MTAALTPGSFSSHSATAPLNGSSLRLRSRSFLLLTVMLGGRGALLAVLFPVTGMAGAPFTRTVAAHLAVFRIGSDLLSVVVGAALSLALGSAADGLAGLKLR